MNTKLVLLNSLSEHRASVIDAKRAEISRLRFLIRILQSGVELAVEEPMEHEWSDMLVSVTYISCLFMLFTIFILPNYFVMIFDVLFQLIMELF